MTPSQDERDEPEGETQVTDEPKDEPKNSLDVYVISTHQSSPWEQSVGFYSPLGTRAGRAEVPTYSTRCPKKSK
jgi:hypothetical protein